MAHILKREEIWPYRAVNRKVMAVRVKRTGKDRLEVQPGADSMSVTRPDALVAKLPDRIEVRGQDGEILKPSQTFWISTETIDPFHFLIDAELE